MTKKWILALPLLAVSGGLSMTAWAQECDAECERYYEMEQKLVGPTARIDRPLSDVLMPVTVIDVIGRALPNPISDPVYSNIYVDVDSLERVENTLRTMSLVSNNFAAPMRGRPILLAKVLPYAVWAAMRRHGRYCSWMVFHRRTRLAAGFPGRAMMRWRLVLLVSAAAGEAEATVAGAIAGTIELFSQDVGNLTELGAAYGSRNSVDADILYSAVNWGRGSSPISANYARGDGFIPIIESQRGSVDRQAEYEQAGLAVRFVAPLSGDIPSSKPISAPSLDDRERGFAV